jgi:non-ribosomal peptide synthetase component F
MAAMARSEQATLFMALVAAVKVLLARYSGSRDILVGHPAAAREHPGLEAQVGFYVNTVALRDELHPQQSFRELLVAVRRTVLEGMEHQAYPFDLLVESLRARVGRGTAPRRGNGAPGAGGGGDEQVRPAVRVP